MEWLLDRKWATNIVIIILSLAIIATGLAGMWASTQMASEATSKENLIVAQQQIIEGYQAQNANVSRVLGLAAETLETVAYGAFTRQEVEGYILEIADIIREINTLLSAQEVEEISRAIIRGAVTAGVDPILLTAIAITESNFRPGLRGRSGEYGLMQVMPGTGQWIAGKLGYADWHPEDMWEIKQNVQFGAYYLRVVTKEFGDRWEGVLAYNRGPSGARNWLDKHIAGEWGYVAKVRRIYKENRVCPLEAVLLI